MKKKLFLFSILLLSIVLVGCSVLKPAEKEGKEKVTTVPETGTIVNATDKDGQEILVVPGDVVELNLTGTESSEFIWTIISPTSEDCISLKEHKNTGTEEGSLIVTSDWKFKVEKFCSVDLSLNYIDFKDIENPKDTFSVKIISQDLQN